MPEKQVEALKEELETKFNVAIDVEQPTEKEDVPVLLTNGKVQGAVEGVVTSFGFPNKWKLINGNNSILLLFLIWNNAVRRSLRIFNVYWMFYSFKKIPEHGRNNGENT